MRSVQKLFLAVLLLAPAAGANLSCAVLGLLRGETGAAADSLGRAERNLRTFDRAWQFVNEEYYDSDVSRDEWAGLKDQFRSQADTASSEASLYATLGAMMETLRDAHTRVRSPEAAGMREEGIAAGLGLRGRWLEGRFVVEEVQEGAPAADAGVQPGWLLTGWDGFPMGNDGLTYVRYTVALGDTVRLRFEDAADSVHVIELYGRLYVDEDPMEEHMLPGNVLYLRFDRFSEEASRWMVDRMRAHPDAAAAIFDLRFNRGGRMSALKRSLAAIYRQPSAFGEERLRGGRSRTLETRGSGRKAFAGRVAVLVDARSQSAAEVFASAVQETGRGFVVGRRTAGNVLISRSEGLPGGGELQVSMRDFVTPSGRRLEGEGVQPDVEVPLRLQDLRFRRDRDLETALRLLGAGDQGN